MSGERWKVIEGFPGYAVSNLGRVKSLERYVTTHSKFGKPYQRYWKETILRPGWSDSLYVTLYDEHGVAKNYVKIHRLVAKAFVANPKGLPHVLHGDDNPKNNVYTNLRWGTHQDNMDDKMLRGRHRWTPNPPRGKDHPLTTLKDRDVRKIRRLVATGNSQKAVAELFGVSQSTVGRIHRREVWKYLE